MPGVVGYNGAGDSDLGTVDPGSISIARGLVADLGGEAIFHLKARAGQTATTNWWGYIWDENGNLLTFGTITSLGSTPSSTILDFDLSGAPVLPTGTYFYYGIQGEQTGTPIFRYDSGTDVFWYTAGNIAYPADTVSPADNTAGQPSLWVEYDAIVDPPAIIIAPVVTGTPQEGETLACSTGSWSNGPTSYTYQWESNFVDIPSATSSMYTLTGSEVGALIRCRVTATNGFGTSSPSESNIVGPVTPGGGGGDPVIVTDPVVSGDTNLLGVVLHCTTGEWDNYPNFFTYQWYRDPGGGPVAISDEVTNTYATVLDDLGCTISCAVTAYN